MSTFGVALDETPEDINFLSPLIFRLQLKRTPNLTYFVQNVNLPGIHINPTQGHPNPFTNIPYPGDHVDFDELTVNFKVQENMADWLEIYNWMIGIGFPENHAQYAAIDNALPGSGDEVKSDISLVVMNSERIPKFNIIFRDAFPITLSSIIFDQAQSDVNYATAACTFKYTLYEFDNLNT